MKDASSPGMESAGLQDYQPAGPVWHAVYTRSRAEKRLMQLLAAKGIEAYVPLVKVMKQWSDRRKLVEEPVIRSYCFVKAEPARYQDVLNTPGAVRYVWFSGKPATIPDRQITLLKTVEANQIPVEQVNNDLPAGTRMRIISGPLSGVEGELVSYAGKRRMVIRIDHIDAALVVSVPMEMIQADKRTGGQVDRRTSGQSDK